MATFQISGIPAPNSEPKWMDDKRYLWFDVERYSRLCNTPSPNSIKQALVEKYGSRHSAGIPLISSSRALRPHTTPRLTRFEESKKERERINPSWSMPSSKGKSTISMMSFTLDGCQTTSEVLLNIAESKSSSKSRKGVPEKQRKISERSATVTSDQARALEVQLKQEILDLTVQLKEKELFHKDDLRRLTSASKEKEEQMNEEHANYVNSLEEIHNEELEKIKDFHHKMADDIKKSSEAREEELRGEIDNLNLALACAEEKHERNLDARVQQRETEVRLELEDTLDHRFKDLKQKLLQQQVFEIDKLSAEHNKQLATVVRDHKIEMEKFLKKFSACAVDKEKLKETLEEMKCLQDENKELKLELKSSQEKVRKLQNQLSDMKVKLSGYQDHFAERVAEVDDKYQLKVRSLMAENADLRKAYVRKCSELFTAQSNTQVIKGEELEVAKEALKAVIEGKSHENVESTQTPSEQELIDYYSDVSCGSNRPKTAPSESTQSSVHINLATAEVQQERSSSGKPKSAGNQNGKSNRADPRCARSALPLLGGKQR